MGLKDRGIKPFKLIIESVKKGVMLTIKRIVLCSVLAVCLAVFLAVCLAVSRQRKRE
jgi:ABC-type arginine/histidine transport system permease subunit